MLTQGDKPWIKERWKRVGLNLNEVWRLEVSIKAAGLKFKDKTTQKVIEVDTDMVNEGEGLDKIYHTFVKKLFSFIVNKPKISNITREPRLILFDDKPAYDRGSICNLSPGNRAERILIKQLWQMSDLYRGAYIWEGRVQAQQFATRIAAATGLYNWLEEKRVEWETPIHK